MQASPDPRTRRDEARDRSSSAQLDVSRLAVVGCYARCSIDHAVGALEQLLRNAHTERLGGLRVDEKLEFLRLLHGQLAGPGSLENPVRIESCMLADGILVGGVGHDRAE